MDFYFFLDNDLYDSAITVSNFPPLSKGQLVGGENSFICFALFKNNEWAVSTYGMLAPNTGLTLRSSETGFSKYEIKNLLVFQSVTPINGRFSALPESTSFFSIPSWRASIKILGNDTSVSYQGEFPSDMTKITKGSIVSMVPHIQNLDGARTYVFYPAFHCNAEVKKGSLKIYNLLTGNMEKNLDLAANTVNCLDLTDIKSDNAQLMLVAEPLMGIPIYFSVNADGSSMSLEHSMAPIEYAINGDLEVRRSLMRTVKEYWSNYAKLS